MAFEFELVKDSFDSYNKAVRLREIDSKTDPETEPYRSKYAAKDLLNDVRNKLSQKCDGEAKDENDGWFVVNAILAHVEYYVGLIAVETEELSNAEERLLKSLKLSEGHDLNHHYVLTAVLALNELGVLWSVRGDNKQAAEYLIKSAQLCQKYRKEVGLSPSSPRDLFRILLNEEPDSDTDNWKLFEDALTHCVYYLAQAYTCIEEPAKAAVCYEITLKRQLDRKEFDGIDWAVNAATLSQFFVTEKNFHAARHLLACATKVLEDHNNRCSEQEDCEDTLKRRKADIARCWAKYGNLLLNVSWNDLLQLSDDLGEVDLNKREKGEGELEKMKEVDVGFSVIEFGGRDPHLMFEIPGADEIEKQVTADRVLDFSQARLVFLNSQKWLNLAKEYYSFEDHASDYIHITQEISQLYKILAQFESQDDRRCKMHKRRIDLLEAVLNGVNQQYYLDFCRQLLFEIGETYNEIMDIKLSVQHESANNVTQHVILKVHSLAFKAIKSFELFVDTFKTNNQLPDELHEDFVRCVLLAHVFMGRLHSKLIATDTKKRIETLQDSLRNYKYVVDYCDRHPSAANVIQHELEVTKEMANLLPMKIERVSCEELC